MIANEIQSNQQTIIAEMYCNVKRSVYVVLLKYKINGMLQSRELEGKAENGQFQMADLAWNWKVRPIKS